MKKLDKRIVRTRRVLVDSLITLALECGYENLTIRMVTEYAGVGNRTFYRHFISLDELLKHILTIAFQKLKERALEAETPHGEVLAFYTFIRDHPDVMRVYVNLPWDHPVRQAILTDAAKIVHDRYELHNATSVPPTLSIEHVLFATNNLVAWYLDHLDAYTPKQVAVMHDVLVLDLLERQSIVLRSDWMQKRHQFR